MEYENIINDIKNFKAKHPFIFLGLIVYLGGLLVYVLIFLLFYADYSSAMSLNEVGDFLAGAFSPLAFLFLYLGYKQQGEEMSRNTAALEAQQVELKNSVEAQNSLLRLHETEQQEKHFQVLPKFIIKKLDHDKVKYPDYDPETGEVLDYEDFLIISFDLENIGEIAKNVLLKSQNNESHLRVYKDIVGKDEKIEVSIWYDGQDIEKFEKGMVVYNTLNLSYNNIYGKTYVKTIPYNVNATFDPSVGEFYFNVSADIKN